MRNCKFRRKHCKFRRLLAQVLFLWYNSNTEKIICEGRSFLCGSSFQNTAVYSHLLHLLSQFAFVNKKLSHLANKKVSQL